MTSNRDHHLQETLQTLNTAAQRIKQEWQQIDDERERLNTIAKDLAKKKAETEKARKEFEEEKEQWNGQNSEYKTLYEAEILKVKKLKQELEDLKKKLQDREDSHPQGQTHIAQQQRPVSGQYAPAKKKILTLVKEFQDEIKKAKQSDNILNKQYAIGAVKTLVSLQNDIAGVVRAGNDTESDHHSSPSPAEKYFSDVLTPTVKEIAASVKTALSTNDFEQLESNLQSLKDQALILDQKFNTEKVQKVESPEYMDDLISTFTPASKSLSVSNPSSSSHKQVTRRTTIGSPGPSDKNVGRTSATGSTTKARIPPSHIEENESVQEDKRSRSSAVELKRAGDDDSSSTHEQQSYAKASSSSPVSIHGTMARPKQSAQKTKFEHLFADPNGDKEKEKDKDKEKEKEKDKEKEKQGDKKMTSTSSAPAIPPVVSQAHTSTVNTREKWKCSKCTVSNEGTSTKCSMCGEPRVSAGVPPAALATTSKEPKEEWRCPKCTVVNSPTSKHCSMCGYSWHEEKEENVDEELNELKARPGRSKSAVHSPVKKKLIPKMEQKST